jgi:hypothetical protein
VEIGDRIYMISFNFESPNIFLDSQIIDGIIISKLDDDKFEVELVETKVRIKVNKKKLHATKEDAERKLCKLWIWKEKDDIRIISNDTNIILPKNLTDSDKVYYCGNPVRMFEQNVIFGCQETALSEEKNVSKILQTIGAAFEDIDMLLSILKILANANDYAKRLIGKYIIIELNSIYSCLSDLSKLSSEYSNDFFNLEETIKNMESKFNFRTIRNKISAHRDSNLYFIETFGLFRDINRYSIIKYIKLFREHVNNLLEKYPIEKEAYFNRRREPLEDIIYFNTPETNPYIPFDEDCSDLNK